MKTVIAKRYGLPICLLAISFLSFQFNLFRVTSQDRFRGFEVYSDALVLDGIVHHRFVPYSGLGLYHRGTSDSRAFLDDQAHIGELQDNRKFEPYHSQFGLQYFVFDFLYTTCGFSVKQLEATASFFMALIVAGYFWALRKTIPAVPALGFCLALALSPWVVCFARNLFWVEATWFLPCLVSLFLGNRRATTANHIALASLLFLCTLLKCLCGYDFITTVCLAAVVPLAYFHAKKSSRVRELVWQLAVAGSAMFLAFVCAMGLHLALLSYHASLLPDTSNASRAANSSSRQSGIAVILLAGEKRFYSKDPDKTAREACADGVGAMSSYDECVSAYKQSLQSNVFKVVARYFLAPEMVPWMSGVVIDESDKVALKTALLDIGARRFPDALRVIGKLHLFFLLYLSYRAASPVLFLTLIGLVGRMIYLRKNRLDLAWAGIAFVSPISWYVAAKGYSQIHTHLCYVLWYLPFVPASIALLLSEYRGSNVSPLG